MSFFPFGLTVGTAAGVTAHSQHWGPAMRHGPLRKVSYVKLLQTCMLHSNDDVQYGIIYASNESPAGHNAIFVSAAVAVYSMMFYLAVTGTILCGLLLIKSKLDPR